MHTTVIHGPLGSGKTLIAEALKEKYLKHSATVGCAEVHFLEEGVREADSNRMLGVDYTILVCNKMSAADVQSLVAKTKALSVIACTKVDVGAALVAFPAATTIGKPNGNGHVYTKEVMDKVVDQINSRARSGNPVMIHSGPYAKDMLGAIMKAEIAEDRVTMDARLMTGILPDRFMEIADQLTLCGSFTGRLNEGGVVSDIKVEYYYLSPKDTLAQADIVTTVGSLLAPASA